MNSICDLEIWEKDALMAWVFDIQEKIFAAKQQRMEILMEKSAQETRRESCGVATQDGGG